MCVCEKRAASHISGKLMRLMSRGENARGRGEVQGGPALWKLVWLFSLSPGWIRSQREKKEHVTEGSGLSFCGSVVEWPIEIQCHLKHTNTAGNIHLLVLQIPSHSTTCHHSYPFLRLIEAIYDVRCTHWLHIGSREAKNSSLCSHLISLCHPTPVFFVVFFV